jgi:hypothetical protein
MKTLKSLTLLAISFAGLLSCQSGPTKEEIKASAEEQLLVNKQLDSVYRILDDAYQSYHPATMDAALEGLNVYLNNAQSKMQQIKPLSQNQKLTGAIEEKIAVMKSVAQNEAIEQVRIYKLPDSVFTEDLIKKWNDLDTSVKQKLSSATKNVENAYNEIQNELKK